MLVTRSQQVQTSSTIQLYLRLQPGYRRVGIFEGVLVRVEDRHITIRNYNQNAVVVNRATLAPDAKQTITVPVVDGWYPPVFIEIIAYEFRSPDVAGVVA